MPLSLQQVEEFLDEHDLTYMTAIERDAVLISFAVDPQQTTYRDRDGDPTIQFVIAVTEQGGFLSIFAPQAWNLADCPHKGAVFEAIASIQSQYKMMRFDYDPADGEIRPNVELPVEDAEVTSDQFHRLMHGLYRGMQRFDGVIRHAMLTGEVSFASVPPDEDEAAPPPSIARLQRLADEAGGIEELERIACGSDEAEERPRTAHDVSRTPAQPSDSSEPVLPQPSPIDMIRRIWDRLFGTDGQDLGEDRKAG